MKRLVSALLLTLVLVVTSIPVFATEAEDDHSYTVTVYAGAQGLVNGKSSDSITAQYGEEINLGNYFSVTLNDGSKYYVRGFRKSGRDNNTVATPVFDITEDTDFVVAYGINGTPVNYTARFVEYGTGRQLADPVTYTGKVGDKPIIAYLYIDGYRPRYRNLGKTLSADETENVFEFQYIPLTVEEPTTQPQPTTTTAPQQQTTTAAPANNPQGGGNTPAAQPGDNQGGNQDGNAANGGNTGGDDTAANPDDNANNPAEEETVNPQDLETEDFGDLDVPLANFNGDDDETSSTGGIETQTNQPTQAANSTSSVWIIIVIIVAILIILFLLWWFLIRKKKQKDDKKTEEPKK